MFTHILKGNLMLLNICSVIYIHAIKLNIGKNFTNYICQYWVENKTNRYTDYFGIYSNYDEAIIKNKEDLFLLLESENNIKDNKIEFSDYEINGNVYNTMPLVGKDEKIIKRTFIIDFSSENPKYNLKFYEIVNGKTNQINLAENNDFLEKKIKKETDNEEYDDIEKKYKEDYDKYINGKKEKIKNIFLNLNNGNSEEKNNKWALFEIKLTNSNNKFYFYCNDISSETNPECGIFDYELEEISVIKSNVSNVENLICFCSPFDNIKKVDISNFEFKKPIDISYLFASKNLEHFILPKTKMYFNNIPYLFKDTNENLKIENFENLEGFDTLYNITNCFDNSNIKNIKFPKCKISKETTVYENYSKKSFLKENNLESIDLSQVTFEKGAGENMFYDTKVKKIIFPESMKNLDKKDLEDIFKNSKIENIKIGEYELNNIDKFDEIPIFIKNPIEYLNKRNEIKEKNIIKHSSKSTVGEKNTENAEEDIETNKDENNNIIEENKKESLEIKDRKKTDKDTNNTITKKKKLNKENFNLIIPNTNCCCLNCSCRG